MPLETLRVLIWAKTYPELSHHHTETVCTGGVLEDGRPVRLYPVQLRYLRQHQQYGLYDWVEVPAARNRKDSRPESYRVNAEAIRVIGNVDTQRGTWRTRRDYIFRNPAWHFPSVGALKLAESESGRSMGLVTPGCIEDVRLRRRTDKERAQHDSTLAAIQSQTDAFGVRYKELEFLEFDVKLLWRCLERCPECQNRPHTMKVLDWGLLELGRRDGWGKAKAKLEEISNLGTYEFRLFLGNFKQHPKSFGIIALWYPKRPAQLDLL